MEYLADVLISGMAVTYVIELLALLTSRIFSPKMLKLLLTLPLSILGCWILGNSGAYLILLSLASSCIALVVVFLVNRPTQVQFATRR